MVVRDDDDMDLEEASSNANMLQNKQAIAQNGQLKRKEQLQRWESSEMNGESQTKRRKALVKFQDSDIFLSACMSGDEDEVEDLLKKGADINTATVDGLTALHQSVIDSKPEMVRFLCEKGADVNAQDNEGWTPLHAAACCGNLPIVKYLCDHGADISIINSDKELAMDLADDETCREFLEGEHESKDIDPDECRDAELTTMMVDAKTWIKEGVYGDKAHSRTGATALHVAAAKGYTQLLEMLIQAGGDIRMRDRDGWTPLHAAAHWCERDSCKILMEHGATVKDVNMAGQDVLTVADKEVVEYLEELEKAAEARRSLPSSNAPVLQEKNARLHHEEHTITSEHKRELQHRDQSSEKDMLHSFAKVPRMEKSPSIEPTVETRKAPAEEERVSSSTERMSERSQSEKSKSSSEPPGSYRSSEERMSASTASERPEKSMSVDRSERSTTASVTPSSASSASSMVSSLASTSTPTSTSLQGDQNVTATVPLRPLQQPNSWINRGVQLISRSNSSGSTRTSIESGSVSSSQQMSTTPSSVPSSASPANPIFTKPLPWQSNVVNESEAERRSTARLQRQNRRSTQGVTKEQLEEARGMAIEDALRRRCSAQTSLGYGASSGTSTRENPALARLASEERDSMSDRSESTDRISTAPGRIGSSVRRTSELESEKSPGRLSPPTTSATLSLPAAPSPGSTPSAANIRRRSQQGMPLSRSNRRGTGPVQAEDLQLAQHHKSDLLSLGSSSRNGLSSTINRTYLTFNRPDSRIGTTVPTPTDKSQSAPPAPSPTGSTPIAPLRSAAINPTNTQRVTSRVAVTTPSYSSQGPQTSSVLTRPTETNLNYKALYEKERTECERLRKELEDARRSDTSLSAYRVTSRLRNGTSTSSPGTAPIGKSPSIGSMEDGDRRSLERKIAELELQVKSVSQLKQENARLKEEHGALVRVISKMSSS